MGMQNAKGLLKTCCNMVYVALQNAFELSQVIFLLAMHSWYMNRFITLSEWIYEKTEPNALPLILGRR
jgi:hypothetical protein